MEISSHTLKRLTGLAGLLCLLAALLFAQVPDSTSAPVILIPDSLSRALSDTTDTVSAQQPFWVQYNKIQDRLTHYYGIGKSQESQLDADTRARINFALNVNAHVTSMMEHSINEKNYRVKENFRNLNRVSSDISLRGFSITEQFEDKKTGTWYSLMRYNKDEYDVIVNQEIAREIQRMKENNEFEESRQQEAIRHQFALSMLGINKERSEESIRNELHKRKEERRNYLKNNYYDFIHTKTFYRIINTPTAEVPDNTHTFSLKSSIQPLVPLEVGYTMRLFKVFEGGVNLYVRNSTVISQDSRVKIQLLPGSGEIYRTALALGFEQYSSHLDQVVNLTENFEDVPFTNSLFVTANVSLPEQYLTLCIFNNKRETSLAALWFPFFKNFGRNLSVAGNLSYTRDPDFRNRFDDRLLFEPGLHFVVIPHRLNTTVAYEQNEYVTLNLDFQF